VLERAAECGHERTELRDATPVFVACHEVMLRALAEPTRESATGRAMSNTGHRVAKSHLRSRSILTA
jgi:hypothetical protein